MPIRREAAKVVKDPGAAPLSARLTPEGQRELREMFVLLYSSLSRLQALRRNLAARVGLDASEFAVLMALDHLERSGHPTRVRDIADLTHGAAANVTATVRKLDQKGWVIKAVSETDSRAVKLRLTERARERVTELRNALVDVNDIWLGTTDINDIRSVARVCSALIDHHARAMAALAAQRR